MIEFEPIPGVKYKYDYEEFFKQQVGLKGDAALEGYRWMCENDLFFLMYFGLGKTFISEPGHDRSYERTAWWVDRIQEVEDGPDSDTLDLWHRGSGKSQIITVSETIQDIFRDPSYTTGIFANTGKLANAFLFVIKTHLEQREILHAWYPDILWGNAQQCKKLAPLWSLEKGIVVKRATQKAECTVEACGLDNQPIGRHYNKGIYDDVVVWASVQTSEQIAKTIETLRLSFNLFSTDHRRRFIGTRYHFADAWGDMIEQVESKEIELHIRKHPIRTPTADGYDYPFFSEEEAELKRAEQGSYIYSCQQLLSPINPDSQIFSPEFTTYYDKVPDGEHMQIYCLGDLAGWDKPGTINKKNDESAFSIVGVTRGEVYDNWYILEVFRGRKNPDEITNWLFSSHARWGWIWCKIEDGKEYRSLKFQLDKEMRSRNHRLNMGVTEHKGQSKDTRIRVQQARWEARAIHFKPEMQPEVTQYVQYPSARFRDFADCMAYGEEYIPRRPKKRTGRRRPRLTARGPYGGW